MKLYLGSDDIEINEEQIYKFKDTILNSKINLTKSMKEIIESIIGIIEISDHPC